MHFHLTAQKNPLFELGAAYYPDYLPEEKLRRLASGEMKLLSKFEHIEEDFRHMKRIGLHTVRMGEFSWSTVEKSLGEFDFSVFHKALAEAQKNLINVIMCTPTTTPPKWLIDAYPDILPVTRKREQIPFGSRRHYDPAHPEYRSHSIRITTKFAHEFGSHPSVKAWQTDNEFGCHNSVFLFTKHQRTEFIRWLREKYHGDIKGLNEAWFTAFWSQGYGNFTQIELPFSSWSDQNPHLELDFRRFSNSIYRSFQKDQCDILRRLSPGRAVTHNFMTTFTDLCPWELSEDLDFAGFDHYQMEAEPHPVTSAWQFGLMKSLKENKKFLILEQQPVQVNWQPTNRRFSIDWLFLWGAQAAFQGASGMYYFSWQKMYGGAEQHHDGILSHDIRNPASQQERMIALKNQFFSQLAQKFDLDSFPDPGSEVLVIYDSESIWSHEITSQSVEYSTRKQIDVIQQTFQSNGYGVEFAKGLNSRELKKYEVVVFPGHAFELTADEKRSLAEYLEKGGKAVSFPRTAFKKRNNQMTEMPLSLITHNDFYVEESGALLANERETVLNENGDVLFDGHLWAEKIVLLAGDWCALASFGPGLYEGSAAIFRKHWGRAGGSHTHIATCPEASRGFSQKLFEALEIKPKLSFSSECGTAQAFPLKLGTRSFYGVVNFHTEESVLLTLNLGKVSHGIKASVLPQCNMTWEEFPSSVDETYALSKRSVSIFELI